MRDWVTKSELDELREHERRRERRANIRLAIIIGLCVVFWAAAIAWFFGGWTP